MSDCYVFDDVNCAFAWMVGIRCMSRTPSATNLRSLRYRLCCDGRALMLSVAFGADDANRVHCIAKLPHAITQEQADNFDWPFKADDLLLDAVALETAEPAGNA